MAPFEIPSEPRDAVSVFRALPVKLSNCWLAGSPSSAASCNLIFPIVSAASTLNTTDVPKSACN